MNASRKNIQTTQESMCSNCKLFYASQAYQGLCSKCYKKNQKKNQSPLHKDLQKLSADNPEIVKTQEVEEERKPIEPQQKDKKRCFNCNKKVGLLGVECRCSFVFCNKHRLPEDHKCTFNHHQAGQKKLEKEVVKVYNGKINEI